MTEPQRPRRRPEDGAGRPGIRHVAERAGVSVTTVSHALNRTRFVSEEARQRIEEAVLALDYVPSEVARWLKHATTRTLGMLVPNNSNPYFADIIRGVERRCSDAGYSLLLCNSDDDAVRQAQHLRVLAERRIDGLVLVAAGDDDEVVAACAHLRLPTVLVDREIAHIAADLVEVDHARGGELATASLLDTGHARVACIGGPEALHPSRQRELGWRRALAARQVTPRDDELARGDFGPESGARAMRRLLEASRPPSAVFVCNDLMAIGALHAAQACGLAVPGALALIGFDDIQLAAYTTPALSTVVQPKEAIGTAAAELLLERILHGRTQSRRVILSPTLCLRDSSGFPGPVAVPRTKRVRA